jgi:ubiquinone/menaquinone biosynthesis C-methylase UbiE
MPNNIHFDWIAPLYEKVIRPPDPQRLKTLLQLPCSGWMLDAAGGTGRVSASLCSLVDRLVISDISFPMLTEGMRKSVGQNGCLVASMARIERMPYPDNCFERILVVDAFHHFDDQQNSLAELTRILAPGGRLVIEEPDIHRFSVKLIALAETLAFMGSRFQTPEVIREMTAAQGLFASLVTDNATAWIIAEKPSLA